MFKINSDASIDITNDFLPLSHSDEQSLII